MHGDRAGRAHGRSAGFPTPVGESDRVRPQSCRIGVESQHDLRPALDDALSQPIAESLPIPCS